MLKVAVTGGIGSGKSTASARLAELGAIVIDSDRLAREVVATGTPGLAAIGDRFGPDMIAGDGSLNRAALAAVIFADSAARRDLEAITHPLVRARFLELASTAAAGAIIVNDIPILTDLAVAAQFHLVIGVGADERVRVRRLIGRGLSEPDARARIAAQIDDRARRPLTDVWLDNNGAPTDLQHRLQRLWADRLIPFNSHLLAGVPAGRSGPAIVPPDPSWPATAQRLMARVSRAAGPDALSVDHIGSTAVPGLPAENVIDLQLGVAATATVDQLAPALSAAGFVRRTGQRWDNGHPAVDSVDGPEAFRVNADPGQPVDLHVRVHGGPGWTWALLSRDWLRASPGPRAEYLAVKLELAARGADDPTVDRYAQGKEAWFDTAGERAQDWSRTVGWRPDHAG